MSFTPKELTWAGLAKETSWGTTVDPTYFVPYSDAKMEDKVEYIADNGIRGALAETYNEIPGFTQGTAELGGDAYPDSFGLAALAILGVDTVNGSASPYTHTFSLARTAQPPSFTLSKFDGTNVRQWGGQVAEELDIKWAEKAAIEYTLKMQGKSSKVRTGTALTPTPTSSIPFSPWIFTAKLNGTQSMNLIGFDLTLKRKTYMQHAISNTQDPTNVVALGLGITGKATFDKEDDTELNMFLNNTQPSLVIKGTQPGSGSSITFQLSKVAFTSAPVDAKDVVQIDVAFTAIDNTSDAGPGEIILGNTVANY